MLIWLLSNCKHLQQISTQGSISQKVLTWDSAHHFSDCWESTKVLLHSTVLDALFFYLRTRETSHSFIEKNLNSSFPWHCHILFSYYQTRCFLMPFCFILLTNSFEKMLHMKWIIELTLFFFRVLCNMQIWSYYFGPDLPCLIKNIYVCVIWITYTFSTRQKSYFRH